MSKIKEAALRLFEQLKSEQKRKKYSKKKEEQ